MMQSEQGSLLCGSVQAGLFRDAAQRVRSAMSSPAKTCAVLIAAAFLAGCSSPTTMYYTLSGASADAVGSPADRSNVESWQHPYRLGSVRVPAQVDDTPLVVRQSSDQLMRLTYDRWTAPLADQFKGSLSLALTQALGMPPLQNLSAPTDRSSSRQSTYQVSVDVQRFDLWPGQSAMLDAVWQVEVPAKEKQTGSGGVNNAQRNRSTLITCYSELRSPAEPGVAPLVTAQQRNVSELAGQIAQVLRTGKPSGNLPDKAQGDRLRCF